MSRRFKHGYSKSEYNNIIENTKTKSGKNLNQPATDNILTSGLIYCEIFLGIYLKKHSTPMIQNMFWHHVKIKSNYSMIINITI